jgi:MarR family transcriptional regulator, temperature-dependent positive regulator of motility
MSFSSNGKRCRTEWQCRTNLGAVSAAGASDQQPSHHNAVNSTAMAKDKSAERLERSPIHLLHRAGQCAGDIFQAEMSSGELTPRQYAVLVTVAHNEGLSQTNLVDRTGIDRSTLADIIRRMLKKGLILRKRTKEDARAYAVRLSEEGWRVLKSAEPLAKRIDDKVIAALPVASRERFIADLNAIVTALGASAPQPVVAPAAKSKSKAKA